MLINDPQSYELGRQDGRSLAPHAARNVRHAESYTRGYDDGIAPVSPGCPECGGTMRIRARKKDGAKFWGCPDFPECGGTRPFNGPVYQHEAALE